jgi:hypothetical protein
MIQPHRGHRTLFQTYLASKSPNTRRIYETTLQRLETWAQRNELDLVQMETADLERFLAEEGRRYSSATIQVRRAALRAFYGSLEDTGMIELDPAYKLRLASIDHLASTGPVAYLTDEAVAGLREHALRLGPISSLAICMLHETPASVRRIAASRSPTSHRTRQRPDLLDPRPKHRHKRPLADQPANPQRRRSPTKRTPASHLAADEEPERPLGQGRDRTNPPQCGHPDAKPSRRAQTRAPSPCPSTRRPDAARVEEPLALSTHAAQGHAAARRVPLAARTLVTHRARGRTRPVSHG